jgi:tetratricopeptide (TPR) repeat protein
MEKYAEARERFTEVIETWPEDSVYSDACGMRGDLLASEGFLDEAQRDYEEAIASARLPRQATYAVFQMASMFELEERYEELLQVVNAYLDRYGEEADVAKAAFWVGKTKLAQGLTDEAIDAYLETIVQFGGDVLQDGVDLIISELLTLYQRLSSEERDALQSTLQDSLQKAENVTLQLRLRVLLAEMNGAANELGAQLNAELDDLTQAPPPVLGILCNSAFEAKDYSRAAEILDLFQTRYEESEFMKSALKLRAFELFETKQYDAALKIAEEAQAIYGMDIAVVWAQLMKGRVFLRQRDFEAARELFRTTLAVSQWRGEAFAEAMYYLGRVEEAAGNLRDAFAWYQRAYFQWKGVAGGYWAAEAYLASARCLKGLGLEIDMLNTYRAMLFDKYVNTLPQAQAAREALGAKVVQEINQMIIDGVQTNITVKIVAEAVQ